MKWCAISIEIITYKKYCCQEFLCKLTSKIFAHAGEDWQTRAARNSRAIAVVRGTRRRNRGIVDSNRREPSSQSDLVQKRQITEGLDTETRGSREYAHADSASSI